MNSESVISFVIAFILAICVTPIARKLAFKIGAVDVPKDDRRVHKVAIARLGGIAIIFSFLLTLVINIVGSRFINWNFSINRELVGFVLASFIIIVVGIVDDIKCLKAKTKLFFQILAAIVVIFIANTRVCVVTNPFSDTGVLELNYFISIAITICWLIGITNAINLIDGLDGLAAGVSAISYISMFFVSWLTGDTNTEILTAILIGSTLGFLPYNFNPAKIFMGDTGSTFLGFTLGVISIRGTLKSYTAISIVIPLLILGIPLFDTAFAILRRIWNGKSIMEADRGHIHHKLLDFGFTQRQAVMLMYCASAILGLSAVELTKKGALGGLILVVLVLLVTLTGAKCISEVLKIKKVQQIKKISNEKIQNK